MFLTSRISITSFVLAFRCEQLFFPIKNKSAFSFIHSWIYKKIINHKSKYLYMYLVI